MARSHSPFCSLYVCIVYMHPIIRIISTLLAVCSPSAFHHSIVRSSDPTQMYPSTTAVRQPRVRVFMCKRIKSNPQNININDHTHTCSCQHRSSCSLRGSAGWCLPSPVFSLPSRPRTSRTCRGIRLHGRRGKGMAESFSREKLRHAPQKEGG